MQQLEILWTNAVTARQQGRDKEAARLLNDLLRQEPRIAEAHLELAQMAAVAGDLEEAEERAREGVRILRAGGQWITTLPEEVMLAFALNLLGETIRRQLEEGELLFTDKELFEKRWKEAAELFAEAERQDPSNPDARANATHVRR